MLKEQLHFFTGANTYTLTEELTRWKQSFREKHGDANLSLLLGGNLLWSTLQGEVSSAPFLGEKRLIIVEGMPDKILKDELASLPHFWHPASILLITESIPDQRKGLTKFLQKEALIKKFPLLGPRELVPWLQSIAKGYARDLPPEIAAHLVAVVGNDQWHLAQECRKLLSYTDQCPTLSNVDYIALPSAKHTVWKMSDLLGKGELTQAVHFLQTLLKQGEDAFALWNIFLWIVKNMATLWIWQQEKPLSMDALIRESGVPFGSAQSLLPLIRHFEEEKMRSLIRHIVEADAALKTGKIKAGAEDSIELVTLLETMILRMG